MAPLTDEQRNATAQQRVKLSSSPLPYGTAESVDQRARLPDPAHVPADVTVRVEIAPPSPHPFPILDGSALKKPERVPIYFFGLRSDRAAPEIVDTPVIFFIHGGGNVVGHPTRAEFAHFCIRLLRAVASRSGEPSKCVLIAPSYRLATVPENAFPAALQDLVAAYDYVLGKGYRPPNITIAGESAGGNHAVVLTHLVLQSNRPSPRGVIAIAPGSIVEWSEQSEQAKANAETDILTPFILEGISSAYVAGTGFARTDPLVSGAFVPFTASWPRTLILVGSGDTLIDQSRQIKRRLAALNSPVELVEYDGRPHGWWTMPDVFLEECQNAAERIALFTLEPPSGRV